MPIKTFILTFLVMLISCTKPEGSKLSNTIEKNSISVQVTPSSQSLRSCDLLELSIELSYPRNLTVKLPNAKSDFGDFSLYENLPGSPVAINEKINTRTQILILEPGLPGPQSLPSLSLIFWNQQGEKTILQTNELKIQVSSTLPTTHNKEMEDIIIHQEPKPQYWLILLTGCLVILPLFYCHFRLKKIAPIPDKPQQLYEQFLALKNLTPKKALQKMPTVVKNIIQEKHLPKDQLELLQQQFQNCDKLRFSKETITTSKLEKLFADFESLLFPLKEPVS
jgi:hypothetical protein